jgi:hypothetical protein
MQTTYGEVMKIHNETKNTMAEIHREKGTHPGEGWEWYGNIGVPFSR